MALMTSLQPLCMWSCLLGGAVLLSGCGSGSTEEHSSSSPPRVTVLVMRHCIRATKEDGIQYSHRYLPDMDYYNNYSESPWPAFNVPAYHCLSRGTKIIEGTGKWLQEKGNLPQPVEVVADDVQRDRVTAAALVSGLSHGDLKFHLRSFSMSGSPFKHKGMPHSCPKFSEEEVTEKIEAQREAIQFPESEFASLTQSLAKILHPSAAEPGREKTADCAVHNNKLTGICNAASAFVERFLMEWGAGMEVAWGRLPLGELPSLLKLHTWYRQIVDAAPDLVARHGASISRAVSAALQGIPGERPDVTRIFVGHDGDLNRLNAALDLVWTPDPFPVNATLPGSGLRFDRVGSTVTVSYIFPTNYSDEGDAMGSMSSVPALFQKSKSNSISLQRLQSMLEHGSVAACATNWTFDALQQAVIV